jgi:hypothetical protein
MEHGAIDLHKKESQVRILTESGEVIDQRIRTTRDRLTALFWGRPHARSRRFESCRARQLRQVSG